LLIKKTISGDFAMTAPQAGALFFALTASLQSGLLLRQAFTG